MLTMANIQYWYSGCQVFLEKFSEFKRDLLRKHRHCFLCRKTSFYDKENVVFYVAVHRFIHRICRNTILTLLTLALCKKCKCNSL